ncbi:cation:proton antiporter [Roseiarcaceae bacterium H3SJ34-1]|uniref:cation:proton antiporter domain-containing protein n=1 Tax=Terripilifer ovatus TaxID=3032367 RepID=UPI003AB96BBD|nr:cation:proton antiporter [Roseiarcaceae bacterium H3SJ34-1]
MGPHIEIADYRETLLFLVTAGVVVPLFRRLRISPVLGFIAAGLFLGPYGLGRFAHLHPWIAAISLSDIEGLAKVSELGVTFLLFMIGLELSFERLSRMRKLVFGLGALQVFVSAIAIALAAFWFGQSAPASAIIGGALALSSTAIVVPVLAERRRMNTGAGRATFSILLFQDLMVAPFLFMVAMLDPRAHANVGLGLISAILPAMLALGVIVGLGRLILRPLFRHVAAARSTEFFMAACLLVVLGTGVATALGGLSMSLGAFIAGLLLAETEFRREIEVTIEPFKGLLLGLFFVSIGAGLDLSYVFNRPVETLGLALVLIAGKAALLFGIGRMVGLSTPVARETALLIGPGGEFAFVMVGAAVAEGAIAAVTGSQVMLAVTLSMVAIPVVAAIAFKLAPPRVEPKIDNEGLAPADEAAGRIIIVGYGRVGRLVGDMLFRHKISYIAVDDDVKLVQREREQDKDKKIYWGDATRPDFLTKCGIATARGIVVTMDAPKAVEEVIQVAHKARADLTIVARARDATHATHLYEIGATDAVPETIEASLQLAEAVLVDIGVPMGLVIASIHDKRDEYRALLQPKNDGARQRRAIRMSTRVKAMGRPARTEKSE